MTATTPPSTAAAPTPPAPAPKTTASDAAKKTEPPKPRVDENVVFTLNEGQVVIRLLDREAPNHCENFKKLVKSGYFDGVPFHRVCPGFAQSGDPTGSGKGGIDTTLAAEIARRPVIRGSVLAARKADDRNPTKASHGSQFLIMKTNQFPWNGQYSIFGQVIRGMEFVDRIAQGTKEDDYAVPAAKASKIVKAEVVQGPVPFAPLVPGASTPSPGTSGLAPRPSAPSMPAPAVTPAPATPVPAAK